MYRSPDGRILAANMETEGLYLFDPKLNLVQNLKGSKSGFNDFSWYPWMQSSFPNSDCLLSVSKHVPVQLWDCSTGLVRCTWSPKDHLDQLATCLSVTFSPDGQKVLAGSKDSIFVFDANRPSSTSSFTISTVESRRDKHGLKGIISCLHCRNDASGLLAAGSFSGGLGIYHMNEKSHIAKLDAFRQGVTQVQFGVTPWQLLAAGRHSNLILEFDLRMLHEHVRSFDLGSEGHRGSQRIYFDIDFTSKCIVTGIGPRLAFFSLDSGLQLASRNDDDMIINSVSVFNDRIAFSTGTRQFIDKDTVPLPPQPSICIIPASHS